MTALGKMVIVLGLIITAVGCVMMFPDKIPFIGRLPGDISIKKEHYRIYVPITTSIVLSLLLSAILWLISLFTKK